MSEMGDERIDGPENLVLTSAAIVALAGASIQAAPGTLALVSSWLGRKGPELLLRVADYEIGYGWQLEAVNGYPDALVIRKVTIKGLKSFSLARKSEKEGIGFALDEEKESEADSEIAKKDASFNFPIVVKSGQAIRFWILSDGDQSSRLSSRDYKVSLEYTVIRDRLKGNAEINLAAI